MSRHPFLSVDARSCPRSETDQAKPNVSWARVVPAGRTLERRGLLGWVSLEINGLVIDGLALRRTREGRLALSWPAKRDRRGVDHYVVRPIDHKTRIEIERQVLDLADDRLGQGGGAA
jgi:hypothetical protein